MSTAGALSAVTARTTPHKEEYLRRKALVAITAGLVVLVAAASAYAAINTYTATVTGLVKGGTPAKPKPTGYAEQLTATGTGGNRTALLSNITTTVYGLKANLEGLPTCTLNSIAAAKARCSVPEGRSAGHRVHPRCRRLADELQHL